MGPTNTKCRAGLSPCRHRWRFGEDNLDDDNHDDNYGVDVDHFLDPTNTKCRARLSPCRLLE